METLTKTIYKTDIGNLHIISPGWLSFDTPECEEATYEGYIYVETETKQFWTGTYHNAVGLETFIGPFNTLKNATQFLQNEGFENYSG